MRRTREPAGGGVSRWPRDVTWALNRAARVGEPTGRNRWRLEPPFRHDGVLVKAAVPRRGFGVSTQKNARRTHVPRTVLTAWKRGQLVGWSVAWSCGPRTAAFELLDSPAAGRPLCAPCSMVAFGRYPVG